MRRNGEGRYGRQCRGSVDAVSGLVVAKSIKDDEKLKDIPIIAVTAFALKGDEERMREGGCAAYLAKPISTPNFLKTVAQYLG